MSFKRLYSTLNEIFTNDKGIRLYKQMRMSLILSLLVISWMIPANNVQAQTVEKSYSNHDFFLGCIHSPKTFYYYFKLELNTNDQSFLYCSMYDGGKNRFHKDMYDIGKWAKKDDTLLLFIERPGLLEGNYCSDTAAFLMKGNELKAIEGLHPWRCMRFRENLIETKSYSENIDFIDRKSWKHVNKRIRRWKRKMRKKARKLSKKAFG